MTLVEKPFDKMKFVEISFYLKKYLLKLANCIWFAKKTFVEMQLSLIKLIFKSC